MDSWWGCISREKEVVLTSLVTQDEAGTFEYNMFSFQVLTAAFSLSIDMGTLSFCCEPVYNLHIFLHSWSDMFAEMLRFADREFYTVTSCAVMLTLTRTHIICTHLCIHTLSTHIHLHTTHMHT